MTVDDTPVPRPVAAIIVLAALYLPGLLPFVAGPLTECDHCVSSYLAILPVLPGFLLVHAIGPSSVGLAYLGAAAVSLFAAGCLFLAVRDNRGLGGTFVVLVMVAQGLQSMFLGAALRA